MKIERVWNLFNRKYGTPAQPYIFGIISNGISISIYMDEQTGDIKSVIEWPFIGDWEAPASEE
jgi:hypothetical protein